MKTDSLKIVDIATSRIVELEQENAALQAESAEKDRVIEKLSRSLHSLESAHEELRRELGFRH